MSTEALHALSPATLRSLAGALQDGPLTAGVSRRALQQIVGVSFAAGAERMLSEWVGSGMTTGHIALLLEAVAEARERALDPGQLLDLVLSGPDVPGVPTGDTAAAMWALVESARAEVLLVGYAVHKGQRIFGRLAERMRLDPDLHVTLCLDITRPYGDTSLADQIVRRFIRQFRAEHWPWPEVPALYYDPRSLDASLDRRSCLHAKCVVVDRREALITSANFTEAAQQRNIEVGVVVRHAPLVERLADYFGALIASGQLRECALDANVGGM